MKNLVIENGYVFTPNEPECSAENPYGKFGLVAGDFVNKTRMPCEE